MKPGLLAAGWPYWGSGYRSGPVLIIIGLFQLETFQNAVWTNLSIAYPNKNLSLMQLLMILEVVGNVFLLVLTCLMPFLFFRRRDLFPRTMIFMLGFNVLFMLLDYIATDAIFDTHMLRENGKEFVRPMVAAIIWIPYLLASEKG